MRKEVSNAIAGIRLAPKEFTRAIAVLCKSLNCSPRSFDLRLTSAEAKAVFEACSEIIDSPDESSAARWNAFRLAKYAVLVPEFTAPIPDFTLGLFLRWATDRDGNVRNEAVRYLNYLDFGSRRFESPERGAFERAFYDNAMIAFIELKSAYDAYVDENREKIAPSDIVSPRWHFPHSAETVDSFLKSTRKAFEYMGFYGFFRKFVEYGMVDDDMLQGSGFGIYCQ